MKVKEAVEYLSQNLNQNQKLQKYVEKNGFDIQKIFTVEDEYYSNSIEKDNGALYLTNKIEGFDFLFITENKFFCTKSHLPIVEGNWYFHTIFLYSQGTNGYCQYKGLLPYSLSFNMTQSEIHAILGEDIVFKRLNKNNIPVAEEWNYDYFSIYITYNPKTLKPKVIQIDTYSAKFPPKKNEVKVLLPEALCTN